MLLGLVVGVNRILDSRYYKLLYRCPKGFNIFRSQAREKPLDCYTYPSGFLILLDAFIFGTVSFHQHIELLQTNLHSKIRYPLHHQERTRV